jgi:FtsP/CotA-like multicopper oxidase with cupredoxin domain
VIVAKGLGMRSSDSLGWQGIRSINRDLMSFRPNPSGRRRVLAGAIALPFAGACAPMARGVLPVPASLCGAPAPAVDRTDEASARYRLSVGGAMQRLLPEPSPPSAIWGYNGGHPGPLLRARQGELLPVLVDNRLEVATTVHWHGLRLHNAMDGVPYVTESPIAPGARALYTLLCRDAGTYWYHPHLRTEEQMVRGLAGAIVVDEPTPPEVDHDLVWVIADWLLAGDATLRGDFDDVRDMSHAGRIGNRVTLNGRLAMFRDGDPDPIRVRPGARVRLRLLNAASARIFQFAFASSAGFDARIVAFDGHPCPPHSIPGEGLALAPAQRVDLMFDMPDGDLRIDDIQEPRRRYTLRGLRAQGPAVPRRPVIAALPPNPWLEPDLARAREVGVRFEGGARGGLTSARVGDRTVGAQELVDRYNMAWTVNGVAARDHEHSPFLSVACGDTVLLRMRNDTLWPHPIHLHGFHFQVLAIDGRPPPQRTVRDTVLMAPMSSVDLAFVADSPGTWMFHCHILQHQAGGMLTTLRVG